jgi:hypothetical protein
LRCGNREIARVKTGIVFYDYERGMITTCPEGFLRVFSDPV